MNAAAATASNGYAHIIAFGANCQVAFNIARAAGEGESFPFDWWNTPLYAVPLLLDQGFAGLIDRDAIRITDDRRTVVHRKFGIFLHHDFPRCPENDLLLDLTDDALAMAETKYARRCRRLERTLASSNRKLIVRFDSPGIDGWMRHYTSEIWRESDYDTFVGTVLANSYPGSCDFLLLHSTARPVLSVSPATARIICDVLPDDPVICRWEGNIAIWQQKLCEVISESQIPHIV